MKELFLPFFAKLTDFQRSNIKKIAFIFTLLCCIILGYFSYMLNTDISHSESSWNKKMNTEPQVAADLLEVSKDATKVLCGTYVEGIHDIDMAHGGYWVNFMTWFRWDGDEIQDMADHFRIYRGVIKQKNIVKSYKSGNTHYQLVRMEAIVDKSFATKRFPLDGQQFVFYLEPFYTAKRVVLVADTKESNVNRNLDIDGYRFEKSLVSTYAYEYRNTRGDIELEKSTDKNIVTELATGVRVKRDGFGLYAKCFIALYGCIIWSLLTLFINIYHHVDPLEMIPEALFGCVANIMVGASLLPEALDMGLLEYVNIWGILIILTATVIIINVNAIRHREALPDGTCYYAASFGRVMFYLITFFAVIGNIILPFIAYNHQF